MKHLDILEKLNPQAATIINNYFNNDQIHHAFLLCLQDDFDQSKIYYPLIEKIINHNAQQYWDPQHFFNMTILGADKKVSKQMLLETKNRLNQSIIENHEAKILVIHNIDQCHINALNALLKFIEEPSSNTYIIMTTKNKGRLLKTILSRSQVILFPKTPITTLQNFLVETENINEQDALLLAHTFTSISQIKKYAPNIAKFKIEAMECLILFIDKPYEVPAFINKHFSYKEDFEVFLLFLRTLLINLQKSLFFKKKLLLKIDSNLLTNLVKSNFNLIKTIEIITNGLDLLKTNTNTYLVKTKIALQLMECYE